MQAMLKTAPKPLQGWKIEPASEADWPAIWAIFSDVVKTGDTYSYAPDTSYDLAMDVWVRAGAQGFVVKNDAGEVVGSYSLRRNHYGLGSHVANAGYMVRADYRGQGVGHAMCAHSLAEAKRQGCISMQFNYVVSTNTRAVECWKAAGFQIIGVSPKSFRHSQHGLVDIYIMHRFLEDV